MRRQPAPSRSSTPDLGSAISALVEARRGRIHPSFDDLLDYALKTLPEESAEPLRDHLAGCAQCSRSVLQMMAGPPEEAWEALQSRLKGSAAPADVRFKRLRFAARSLRTPRPDCRSLWAWALAASLALASVGFGFWTRQELRQIRQPTSNVVITDLVPVDRILRGRVDPEEAVSILDGGHPFLLILNSTAPPTSSGYRAELSDDEGRRLYSWTNLRAGAPWTPDGARQPRNPR